MINWCINVVCQPQLEINACKGISIIVIKVMRNNRFKTYRLLYSWNLKECSSHTPISVTTEQEEHFTDDAPCWYISNTSQLPHLTSPTSWAEKQGSSFYKKALPLWQYRTHCKTKDYLHQNRTEVLWKGKTRHLDKNRLDTLMHTCKWQKDLLVIIIWNFVSNVELNDLRSTIICAAPQI